MTAALKMDEWRIHCESGRVFLERATGKIVEFCTDETGELMDVDEDGRCGMCGEKHVPTLEEVEAVPGRYIQLPAVREFDGWDLMREYAAAITDADLRGRLEVAIHGPGAFRYFRDVVEEAGRREDWENFREQQLENSLREWCKENGVGLME